MNSSGVVGLYESLAELTARMLATARQGLWDELVELAERREAILATIKPLDATETLDTASRQRKNELIQTVLTQDAEIRERVEHWMAEFQLDMQSNARELRLLREYSP